MRLISLIGLRLTIALSCITALWAGFFYFAMVDEINDEVDDMLEEYSEDLIMRFLAGEEMPARSKRTNNEYYIEPLSAQDAKALPHITYRDSMIYIPQKGEQEPARILTHIFETSQGNHYRLTVLTPTIEKFDLTLNILYWIIVLFLGLLLSLLVVSLWIYHQSNKPLRRLLRWLEAYRLGQTNTPLTNQTRIIEFQKLNEAAISNAQRAEELFTEQRLFIGNVSHELQTPIAIMRHRIEHLLEQEGLTESQLSQIALVYERLEYMTRLSKTLLLLSRIDNGQFTNRQPVDIRARIEELRTEYEAIYSHAELRVSSTYISAQPWTIDPTLADILLHNLLKNAFTHTPHHGAIHINMERETLSISNTAQDGAALDAHHIFERFYQGGKRREGSTGLGLALARAVSKVEDLSITYAYTDGMHRFTVLPNR